MRIKDLPDRRTLYEYHAASSDDDVTTENVLNLRVVFQVLSSTFAAHLNTNYWN